MSGARVVRRTHSGRIVALAAFALAPAALAAQTAGAPPATPPADTTRRAPVAVAGPAVVPQTDQARGVDAEVRVALFELLNGQYVPAVTRLQFVQGSPSALAGAAASPGALRGRQEVLFLLSQGYYRLGQDAAFRSTAEALLAGGAAQRFAPILRTQLLLEAYRRGDVARTAQLAQGLGGAESQGLGALVAGLSAYQGRNFTAARAQFARAAAGNTMYAAYARYMDALSQLRQDTARTEPALAALQQVASNTVGEFADQVRLTAAQLAYESGQYPQAAALAAQIAPGSGLGAQALLTRAWALYKADQVQEAGEAFASFAQQFPQLPERDETRLMAAQSYLQLGRTDDAANIFRAVADSAAAEAADMQSRNAASMAEAARALVGASAAGLLFLADPASGKTVELQEAAGSDRTALASAVNDTVTVVAEIGAPSIVSLADLNERDASLGEAAASVPRRLLYAQTSASGARLDYASRASALYQADVQVALASYQLRQRLGANARQLAVLRAMQRGLAAEDARIAALTAQLAAAQDSLARVGSSLDASAQRIRQIFLVQASETRRLAAENQAMLDSARATIAPSATAQDNEVLTAESQTAATYRALADAVERSIDQAIARSPAFVLRDSVRARTAGIQRLTTETRAALERARAAVDGELARLDGADNDAISGIRAALATAEQQRSAAETQLVGVVERELAARASEMVAGLRRDTEAAQFGVASASFFKSLADSVTASTGGPGSASIGTGTGAAGTSTVSAPGSTGAAPAGAPAAGMPTSIPRK